MPELPEIESTLRTIIPEVVGAYCTKVLLKSSRLSQTVNAQDLVGRKLLNVARRGKYLLFMFSGNETMLLHFALTGKLLVNISGPNERMFLQFDNGRCLHFFDQRNFAKMWILPTSHIWEFSLLKELGPDATEFGFDGRYLYRAVPGSTLSVKEWLMDQHKVAGVGNIYATEACYAAGIDPHRYAVTLRLEECIRLVGALQSLLQTYISVETEYGWAKGYELHECYGHDGQPCKKCGHIIQKDNLGGRGTCWCPYCQK